MSQSSLDLYSLDNLKRIMKNVENKGKLKKGFYSGEVESLSKKIKKKVSETRQKPKSERVSDLYEIAEEREKMAEMKETELMQRCKDIESGKAKFNIKEKEIKGHDALVAGDITTYLVCQIIKQELRRSYKLYPSNLNSIIEQVIALLDNPMPKLLIRADVCSFFESIPQDKLMEKLSEDGYVSKRTLKYLKGMLFTCNEICENKERTGVPRGLSFSSYLSELYMKPVDQEIRSIEGIYFYKRFVDDIIIVADPALSSANEYWDKIDHILRAQSLQLHEDSKKKYLEKLDHSTVNAQFEYLGYHFTYSEGKLSIDISEKRYNKLLTLIDAIFEIYAQCSHYRKGKEKPEGERNNMRRDSLHQLISRIKTITSNGFLSGRKNFVSSGIYYSNKYITDLRKLEQLDEYLHSKIDDRNSFCPPSCLFNYGEGNGHEENIAKLRDYLHQFSFVSGFKERKVFRKGYYSRTLMDLQHIYYSRQK